MTINDLLNSGILDINPNISIHYREPINQEPLKINEIKPKNNSNYTQVVIELQDNRPKWKWTKVPPELYNKPLKNINFDEDDEIIVEFEE